jgi:hypothetical protein
MVLLKSSVHFTPLYAIFKNAKQSQKIGPFSKLLKEIFRKMLVAHSLNNNPSKIFDLRQVL